MTSTSTLTADVELRQPAKSRHLAKLPIPRADPDPSDRFASGGGPCRDLAGYRRRRHVWLDNGRCLHCDTLRPAEPIA